MNINAMSPLVFLKAGVCVAGLFALVVAGALAQAGPPPPDATPGAPGVVGVVLGGIDPGAAPGHGMELRELTWEPGAYATGHFHPAAFVACVQFGALGFSIQSGAAIVTRGGAGEAPEATEPLAVATKVVLEPRDCVAVDEAAAHTIHTAWNADEGPTVTVEAYLFARGEPFTTFVDAMGTPVP